jgi:hypothetical protein
MDVLVPGLYLWLSQWGVRLGGCSAEDGYPGVLHSWAGIAIVLGIGFGQPIGEIMTLDRLDC